MSVTQQEPVLQYVGTIQNGKIVVNEPIDLPDGTPVHITAATKPATVEAEDCENSPERIAAWLKWYDSFKPISQNPIEAKETEEWLKKMSELAIVKMEQEAGEIFK